METSERSIIPDSLPQSGQQTYEIEGANISVFWEKFTPQEHLDIDPKKAVIFIPGWSIPQNASSLKPMGQEFARYSGSNAFIIDTVTEKTTQGNLIQEAKALIKFIKERGLKNVTLVGNSQGGAEAIHLAALLQEQHPDIQIEGLALFDPVTLYETQRRKLFTSYMLDILKTHIALLHPPKNKNRDEDIFRQNAKYDIDGIVGILRGIIHDKGFGFPTRVWNELSEMAKQNPDLAKVSVPVVIIQGSRDKVSNPQSTIPSNDPDSKLHYIEDQNEREKYLRDNIFPNSPSVRVIVPEKMGYHNISYSRPESVARTALYLLRRSHRQSIGKPQ